MEQRSPAIPTLRAIDDYMNKTFPTIYRGEHHSTPSAEKDIMKLEQQYTSEQLYYSQGRKVGLGDKVKDFVELGVTNADRHVLPRWKERRAMYRYETSQSWPEE